MKQKQPYKKYPYKTWELEFITSGLNLNAFGKSKGMDNDTVQSMYRHAKKNGWEEKRDAYFAKAREIIMAKGPVELADKWLEYRGALSDVRGIVRRAIKETGKAVESNNPKVLLGLIGTMKEAADTLDKLAKLDSFMDGGPTERTENKSLNVSLTAIVDKIERGEL